MANRLRLETSPYLLQHANNPVDWYAWGDEALERARREDKPILISIGYSACHWCHVMEHESFENPEIAAIMNEHFVNIKVDREERPDLDQIYMEAVQAMTGHGGWPMTVFLTPDGKPFYGGTYFPPEDRHGLPGFPKVLLAVAEAFRDRRQEVEASSSQLTGHLGQAVDLGAQAGELQVNLLDRAFYGLASQFDAVNGGFGGAPKFPQPMALEFALRTYHRTGESQALWIVERTLEKMATGGVYDQIGGGFHRYAVDAAWLVPHFEKMLYDNALLSRAYLHAYQVTGNDTYRRVCEETLDYVVREMTSPEGGFYSTQDADSEGVEGKFYVWQPEEVRAVLGEEDGDLFNRYFDVTPGGNWEGVSILHVPKDIDVVAKESGVSVEHLADVIVRGRQLLYEAREERVHPGRDEKVLTGWNGLMLHSFAEAATVLDRDDYREVAVRNASFLLSTLIVDGRVLRSFKDGQARLNGYLEDYASLARGLLALYEATFDLRWFEEAERLTKKFVAEFWDQENGGFFETGHSHETLIARPKSFLDNAIPSGNSLAVDVLQRLSILTGDPEYDRKSTIVLQGLRESMAQHPLAFGRMLCNLDFHLGSPKEVAVIGAPSDARTRALLDTALKPYRPNKVVAHTTPGDDASARAIPLLADRREIDGQPAAYVCRHFTCQMPVTSPEALAGQLSA